MFFARAGVLAGQAESLTASTVMSGEVERRARA